MSLQLLTFILLNTILVKRGECRTVKHIHATYSYLMLIVFLSSLKLTYVKQFKLDQIF